jgi:peptidyl-dipeptidase A
MKNVLSAATSLLVLFSLSCARTQSSPEPTAAEAKAFLDNVNQTMLKLGIEANQGGWVQQNFITDDTEALGARTNQRYIEAVAKAVKETPRFDKLDLPADQRRQITVLKTSLVMATPSDPKEAEELTTIAARMNGTYGKGKWCPDSKNPDTCMNIDDITKVMADVRDPKQLLRAWEGWHTISPPMRNDYTRFVELSNKGARELGFADTGTMWRSKYDMPPDEFTKELDRLWDQVRPLYLKLHAYVRIKLREKYGDVVPANGPIPAYLLGNIWAQEWGNIYPLVAPANADVGYSLTDILKRRKTDAIEMVRIGERFYSSLGRAIARSCVTPARGTSTMPPMCASRCASTRRPRISPRFTTSSATTTISAPIRTSRTSSATARTTASTKPSATRPRCR